MEEKKDNNDNKDESKQLELENIETVKGPKNIDIFTHIKLGVKNGKKKLWMQSPL